MEMSHFIWLDVPLVECFEIDLNRSTVICKLCHCDIIPQVLMKGFLHL